MREIEAAADDGNYRAILAIKTYAYRVRKYIGAYVAAMEGPFGQVTIEKGVICAMRHIHMTPEDALKMGLKDKDVVRVKVMGDRELIFGDVLVRVHPDFKLFMHIDTDEANAANLKNGTIGYVESIQLRN